MGLEKDLEKARKKGYWVSVTTKFQYNTYGKIKEIDGDVVRICPYHYISTPFGSVGGEGLYFEKVEDKDISILLKEIVAIVPMPDAVIKKIEEKAAEIMSANKKKTGFND